MQKRMLAQSLIDNYRVSNKRACKVVLFSPSHWYYKHHRREDTIVRMRIKEIAATRVRYGFERICTLLKQDGWKDNHKRIYRIYREEGLNLRSKRPRTSKAAAHRMDRPVLNGFYQCCRMNFVADQLFDGRKF